MSGELMLWLVDEAKKYFVQQTSYLIEANTVLVQKRQKQLETGNKTYSSNKKKKRVARQRFDFKYQFSMDRNLQLSYSQLNWIGWRKQKPKQTETSKTCYQMKRKSQINWSEGEEAILECYKKGYSYASCRVARTDKRELLRIAQEVQAMNRIRRTCLPILRRPPSLTVQPPLGSELHSSNVSVDKKTENTKPKPSKKALLQKRRRTKSCTIKKKVTSSDRSKSEGREYLQISTVNMNIGYFPKKLLKNCFKKPLKLQNIDEPVTHDEMASFKEEYSGFTNPKDVVRNEHYCSSGINKYTEHFPLISLANNDSYKGKLLLQLCNDNYQTNKLEIDKLSIFSQTDNKKQISETVFRIERPKLLDKFQSVHSDNYKLKPTFNNSNQEALHERKTEDNIPVSEILTSHEKHKHPTNNRQKEQTKTLDPMKKTMSNDRCSNHDKRINRSDNIKRKKTYINILKPVVMSTKSGTSFELKPSPLNYDHVNIYKNGYVNI